MLGLFLPLAVPSASGIPRIHLTTVTVYDGLNTVILNATAFIEESGGQPSDRVLTYIWDMGDGTIREGPNVSHTYALQGVWAAYQVELRACTPSGSVCETRFLPILLIHWPAVLVLLGSLVVILWLVGRRRVKFRIVRI